MNEQILLFFYSDFKYVTCGSVLKLLNPKHNVRLHSHEVKYGSGSGQQVSKFAYKIRLNFKWDLHLLWTDAYNSFPACDHLSVSVYLVFFPNLNFFKITSLIFWICKIMKKL